MIHSNSASWRVCMRSVTCGCRPSPPKWPSPTRIPTNSPSSKSSRCGISDEVFHRQETRETPARGGPSSGVGGGGHDEVAVGLVALGVRLDVAAHAQVLVHQAALAGHHG